MPPECAPEKHPTSPVGSAVQDNAADLGGKAGEPALAPRAANPVTHPVAAADSGGGYDAHNSVRFEEQAADTPSELTLGTDVEAPQPLIIAPDASLVDGLRALLVHHLKRSVGSNMVSLSASQAELLEHHLARLASYAQKIVHTLAFATRFLSKQNDGPDGYPNNPQQFSPGPAGAPHNQQYRPGEGNGSHPAVGGQPQADQGPPKPPRKSLKLSDDEILNIYRNAQVEAAIEADWRGIEGPAAKARSWSDGEGTTRSGTGSAPPAGAQEAQGEDREYLRMLSRALQEPGRSPRALTAEILDPSKGTVCCAPGRPMTMTRPAGSSGLPSATNSHRNDQPGH